MGWFDRKKATRGGGRIARDEVEARVRDIVIDTLRVPGEKVVDSARFDIDLGADTLDCVELIVNCEDSLGVMIPESDGDGLTTFGKLVDYIVQRLS